LSSGEIWLQAIAIERIRESLVTRQHINAETTSPNRPAQSSPRRRSGLPPGHYSPPMTGTRLGSRIFACISRPHNYLAQRKSTRVPHPQSELHRCTSVTPPLHLRYASVAPPYRLQRYYGGTTEVLHYGGVTEVLRWWWAV